MGTEFWWFYDVLILTIAACLLYNAVERGFNKLVFRLAGFVLSFVIAFFASAPLGNLAYRSIFKDNITTQIQTDITETDYFEAMAATLRRQFPQSEYADMDRQQLIASLQDGQMNSSYAQAAGSVLQTQLSQSISLFPQQTLEEFAVENEAVMHAFLTALIGEDAERASDNLEANYFESFYQKQIRMAVFLLIELVVLIIVGIISAMAGDVEEFMHVSVFDRLLGAMVGLVEIACVLFSVVIAVRLIVMSTDNMMILFNEPTIAATQLFRFLYQWIRL